MLRRFSQSDWYAYAGAEKFSDGSEPFIFESEKNGVYLTLIGDINGIEVDLNSGEGEDSEQNIWTENINNATQTKIEGIMRHIIKSLDLEGDWYAPDVSYALDHAFNGISNV